MSIPDRIRIVLPDGNGRNFTPGDEQFAAVEALKLGSRLKCAKHFFGGYSVYEITQERLSDGVVRFVLVH